MICSQSEYEFSFLHLTFQEYLVARAIARSPERETLINEALTNHLYNPAWHEVLRLLGGAWNDTHDLRNSRKHSREYIGKLVLANEKDFYCRPLLIAAAAAGEAHRFAPDDCQDFAKQFLRFALHPPQWLEREYICAALVEIGPDIVLPFLAEILGHEIDKDQRRQIRNYILEKIGPAASPLLIAMYRKGLDKDDWAYSIGKLGPAAASVAPELWQSLLNAEETSTQESLAGALLRIGVGRDRLPDLLTFLREHLIDKDVGKTIAKIIAGMGPDVIPGLINSLRYGGDERRYVRQALILIGEPAVQPLLRTLTEILHDNLADCYSFRTSSIIFTLGKIGPPATPAVPILLEALRNSQRDLFHCEDSYFLDYDTSAILGIAETLDVSRYHLLLNYKSDIFEIVEALGNIGDAASPAIPILREMLRQEHRYCFNKYHDYNLRETVVTALGRIGLAAVSALPDILRLLRDSYPDDDEYPVKEIVEAIGLLGPAAESAIPELISLLEGCASNKIFINTQLRWEIHDYIGRALGRIGPASLTTLLNLLCRYEEDSRGMIIRIDSLTNEFAQAISGFGADLEQKLPEMLNTIIGTDRTTNGIARGLLWRIFGELSPTSTWAVPLLLDALENEYYIFNLYYLAQALGNFGPAAASAIETLLPFMFFEASLLDEESKDDDDNKKWCSLVRLGTVNALGKIGVAAKPAIPALMEKLQTEPPERTEESSGDLFQYIIKALNKLGTNEEVVKVVAGLDLSDDERMKLLNLLTPPQMPISPHEIAWFKFQQNVQEPFATLDFVQETASSLKQPKSVFHRFFAHLFNRALLQ